MNGRELSAKAFAEELARRLRVYDAITVKDDTHLKRVKEEILRNFIILCLSEDFARDQKMIVRKEDIDLEVNSVRANYPNDEAFRASLADQRLDFKDWVDKIRLTLLNRSISENLRKNLVQPTSEEIRTFYQSNKNDFQVPEQIRLRQVVLSTESDAEAVQAELQRGRSFKDLAAKFSIAPEAAKGGDTGWIDKGTLEIFDRGFKMDRGQRSPILKSDYGYHIFEVLDKRRAQVLSFEEVKPKILRTIMEKREQAAYTSWLESQLRKAHVFRDDVLIDRMKAETRGEEI